MTCMIGQSARLRMPQTQLSGEEEQPLTRPKRQKGNLSTGYFVRLVNLALASSARGPTCIRTIKMAYSRLLRA